VSSRVPPALPYEHPRQHTISPTSTSANAGASGRLEPLPPISKPTTGSSTGATSALLGFDDEEPLGLGDDSGHVAAVSPAAGSVAPASSDGAAKKATASESKKHDDGREGDQKPIARTAEGAPAERVSASETERFESLLDSGEGAGTHDSLSGFVDEDDHVPSDSFGGLITSPGSKRISSTVATTGDNARSHNDTSVAAGGPPPPSPPASLAQSQRTKSQSSMVNNLKGSAAGTAATAEVGAASGDVRSPAPTTDPAKSATPTATAAARSAPAPASPPSPLPAMPVGRRGGGSAGTATDTDDLEALDELCGDGDVGTGELLDESDAAPASNGARANPVVAGGDGVVPGDVDLNKVSDVENKRAKALMEEGFRRNQIKPGDPGYQYDVQVRPRAARKEQRKGGD